MSWCIKCDCVELGDILIIFFQGFRGERGREGPPGPDGKRVSTNSDF